MGGYAEALRILAEVERAFETVEVLSSSSSNSAPVTGVSGVARRGHQEARSKSNAKQAAALEEVSGRGKKGKEKQKEKQKQKPKQDSNQIKKNAVKKPDPVEVPASVATTNLLFRRATYTFADEGARVLWVSRTPLGTKDGPFVVVLDRTIFHPQGGGQPSDTGTLTLTPADAGSDGVVFRVRMARLVNGRVLHFGSFEGEGDDAISSMSPEKCAGLVGASAKAVISEEDRRLFARLHSAGHVIDVAMVRAKYDLEAGKGHHFTDNPHVEYALGDLEWTPELGEAIHRDIQAAFDVIVTEARPLSVRSVEYAALAGCLVNGKVPAYLPVGQPARVVTIAGEGGCPCGGTHVNDTSELAGIKIVQVQKKGRNIRVRYNAA